MDEQRQDDYLNLINALLGCTSDEEINRLLDTNQDLINPGLVQMMGQVAEMLTERGDENAAYFLSDFARQLAEELGCLSSNHISFKMLNSDSQLSFILQVLQVIYHSNNDPQLVYPLLQANLDKLNNNLARVLVGWATARLAEIQLGQTQIMAAAIGNFSTLIRDFPSGNRADNLEIAITGYKIATTALTYKISPQSWAIMQYNLGESYLQRIRGERGENLESAICCYEAALKVCTRQAFPKQWSDVVNSLGEAYRNRIQGERGENLESAIRCYKAALEIRTRTAFPYGWAMTQNNLGAAYSERIWGEKAENLENAICCYEAALEVYDRQNFSQDWAILQHNLGSAYNKRIWGEKAENLEVAIRCYEAALEVHTHQDFPSEWAMTQNNLGCVYIERIRGEKAENLEVAIRCYETALEVYTRQDFPSEWAMTKNNFGIAYSERILGKKAENLEAAICCYRVTLEVYTRQSFPQDWAKTQLNLGSAFHERIRGKKIENLETAICYYEAALEIQTRQAFPEQWAAIQNNLGIAYRDRIRGQKIENLEATIRYYQAALEVRTREAFPELWALTQDNLGVAYRCRILGKKAENLQAAICCHKAALEVLNRQFFPYEWAGAKINLGVAYSDSLWKERTKNLELVIRCYSDALEVYTREGFPELWALIKNNLGVAYRYRILEEKTENLQAAISCLLDALAVRTRYTVPESYAVTKFNLGLAYYDVSHFLKAYNTFKKAIETVESLREEILFGSGIEQDKQKLAEKWNGLYVYMVEVCLELSYYDQAIEYAENSKTQNLVELILTRDRHTIFPPEVVAQLDRLRDEIASGQYELQNATAEDPTALAQHLQQLRQQRNELQDRYLPIGSGFQFEPFRSTLSDRTAIVEFYITADKLLVFIITKHTQQPIVLSPDLINLKKLANWANSYLKAYSNQKSHWQRRLTTRLYLLAKILHIDEIIQQIPIECDKLILIPHRYLHLLPLHALPLAEDSSLFDRFPRGVSYAPSCQLLQLAQTRQRPEFTHLFAVQNPTGDLSYTDIEVETIQSYFNTNNLLKQELATKEAINDTSLTAVHCAHFSCHGYFNGSEPRKSALILANAELNSAPTQPDAESYLSLENGGVLDLNKCLTLDSIFTLNLEQCRLVTLSACETGLIDFHNTSDEYIGLPSGFLYAGASSVVSSLWTVNDLSTAFLMICFYQNLQKGLTVGLALNQAQLWLKDLTKGALEAWIEENQLQLKPAIRMNLRRRLYRLEDNAKPFELPFYWAAFCAID
jgi:CHAT domain-containing protein